jgi:hypothetical protein
MPRTNIAKQFSVGTGAWVPIITPSDFETASIEVPAEMLVRTTEADSTTEFTLVEDAQWNFNTARQEGGRTPYPTGTVVAYLKSVSGTHTVILRGVVEA